MLIVPVPESTIKNADDLPAGTIVLSENQATKDILRAAIIGAVAQMLVVAIFKKVTE